MAETETILPKTILRLLTKFPDGASVHQLLESLPKTIARRSLQRTLMSLVDTNQISRLGAGRGAKYHLFENKPLHKLQINSDNSAKTDLQIIFSKKSIELKKCVNQPLAKRKVVKYNRKFLVGYQPNVTRYISEKVTHELAKIASLNVENLDAGTYTSTLYQRLLIDLSWNSSRLEGNTYSLLETSQLLQSGNAAETRNAIETQMILNHKSAIEFLVLNHRDIGTNSFTILNVHALLSENLLSSAQAEGRLRNIAVGIGGSAYHPISEPQRIQEYFEIVLKKASLIKNPFEQSFFLMVQLPYLQPFEDVNKRVSRLVANIPFIRNSLSPISFVDVPIKDYIDGLLAIYELNDVSLLRDVYIWAYKRSAFRYASVRHTVGDPDPFKLQFRNEIKTTVASVIKEKLDRKSAIDFIKKSAQQIDTANRKSFIDVVEGEL